MNLEEQARLYAEATDRAGAFRCGRCGWESNDRRLFEEWKWNATGLVCRSYASCRARLAEKEKTEASSS